MTNGKFMSRLKKTDHAKYERISIDIGMRILISNIERYGETNMASKLAKKDLICWTKTEYRGEYD